MKASRPILVCGGNSSASAIALRFFNSGLKTIIYVEPDEIFLRHNLCFGDAVYQNKKIIEDVTAEIISEDLIKTDATGSYLEKINNAIDYTLKDRKIPVIHLLSFTDIVQIINPGIVINTLPQNIQLNSATVLGCYPHHIPGIDCNIAVETRLNYRLGAIYYPETQSISEEKADLHFFKIPFEYCSIPIEGVWIALKEIGETIRYNEALGKIDEVEIRCPYDGQIWGIAHSGKIYPQKTRITQIYTGPPTENFRHFSFRENAVAGGFLEAVLRILE